MAQGTIITRVVTVRRNGRTRAEKHYQCRIRVHGKQKAKTFTKRKEADAWLDRHSTEVREHTYRELNPGTFAEYVESWKERYLVVEELKPATLNGYGSILAKHLVPAFGHQPIAAIAPADIKSFRSRVVKSGRKPKTVSNIMALLGLVLDDAREDGYLRVSPMPTRKKRSSDSQTPARDGQRRGRALQPAQAQRLLAECDAELSLVVLLGLLAGLRRGEIFGLHFEDVDWDRDLIHVRHALYWRYGKYQKLDEGEPRWMIGTPKKKSVRDVDLSPDLKDALWTRYMEMQMEGKAGLVFQSGKGGPLEPQNVYERRFRPACDRVREKAESVSNDPGRSHAERDEATATARMFEGLRLHDLRHSFGSWLLDQGEDLVYTSRQMGHASPSITADVYSHLIREKRPEAAAKMSARLTGVG